MESPRRPGAGMAGMLPRGAGAAALVASGIFIGWAWANHGPGGRGGDDPASAARRSPHGAGAEGEHDAPGGRRERRPDGRVGSASGTALPTSIPPGKAREWLIERIPGSPDEDIASLMHAFQQCAALDRDSSRELLSTVLEISTLMAARDGGQDEDGKIGAALADIPPGLRQSDFLGPLAMFAAFRLAQQDPAAALDLLDGHPEVDSPAELKWVVLGAMTQQDPVKAMALVDSARPEERGAMMTSLISAWSTRDPEMVYKLLAKYPEVELNGMRAHFISLAAREDPGKALDMAVRMAEETKDGTLLQDSLGRLLYEPEIRDGIRKWATGYHGPGEAVVQAHLLQWTAHDDPAKAAADYGKLLAAGHDEDLSSYADTLMEALASRSPAEARTWAETLPPGDARTHAEMKLAEVWVNENPKAAAEWINTLPAGMPRDHAAGKLAEVMKLNLPDEAFHWAESIQDEAARRSAMSSTLAAWEKQDPDAAREAREEYLKKHGPADPGTLVE